jgi:hypothetical protein
MTAPVLSQAKKIVSDICRYVFQIRTQVLSFRSLDCKLRHREDCIGDARGEECTHCVVKHTKDRVRRLFSYRSREWDIACSIATTLKDFGKLTEDKAADIIHDLAQDLGHELYGKLRGYYDSGIDGRGKNNREDENIAGNAETPHDDQCLVKEEEAGDLTPSKQEIGCDFGSGRKRKDLALHSDDLLILAALAKMPSLCHDQITIETVSGVSRRSLSSRLSVMREKGLTHRPNGERSGEQITEEGLSLLEELHPS